MVCSHVLVCPHAVAVQVGSGPVLVFGLYRCWTSSVSCLCRVGSLSAGRGEGASEALAATPTASQPAL